MKTPKNSDSNFQINVDLGIIATNRGTLKRCYKNLESQLKHKLTWAPLFGITLTCLGPLVSAKFNDFLLGASHWKALYDIIAVLSFLSAAFYGIRYLRNRPSEEDFINSIEEESPPLSGQALEKFLSIHGLSIETSDKESFDESKVYTLSSASVRAHEQTHIEMFENEPDKNDEPTDSNAP